MNILLTLLYSVVWLACTILGSIDRNEYFE